MTTLWNSFRHRILLVLCVLALAAGAYAQQWATNGNNISNTNIGNVGVGTGSPSDRLEVAGPGNMPFNIEIDKARGLWDAPHHASAMPLTRPIAQTW